MGSDLTGPGRSLTGLTGDFDMRFKDEKERKEEESMNKEKS